MPEGPPPDASVGGPVEGKRSLPEAAGRCSARRRGQGRRLLCRQGGLGHEASRVSRASSGSDDGVSRVHRTPSLAGGRDETASDQSLNLNTRSSVVGFVTPIAVGLALAIVIALVALASQDISSEHLAALRANFYLKAVGLASP